MILARSTLLVALAVLVSACSGGSSEPPPPPLGTTVSVTGGILEGERLEGAPAVHVFRGIPYAAPPVGELRWRPPQLILAWEGVRPAREFGPVCVQPEMRGFYAGETYPQSEDCLTLNVWTAAETAADRRPVMVWIHGGGLTVGSSRSPVYDGTVLAREGAVVVSINYRLNAFGFLAHPALSAESEHDSSSHYGLLDQIAALEWVRDNITAFGGDPGRVTIFGESAGSLSVHLLCTTPHARGLFHRAIGESGAAFAPVQPLRGEGPRGPSSEAIGELFAKALGVADADDVPAALRAKPAEEILTTFTSNPLFGTYWAFTPVDGWVLPDQPREVYARGQQADVPVMVGTNGDEGTALIDLFPPEWHATADGYAEAVRANYGDAADDLLELYPAATDDAARGALTELISDDLFHFPARAWARGMASVASPAYLYHFTHVPPIPESERYGSFHAGEIPYVFGTRWPGATWSEADERLSATMRGIWLRFAATGDPNGDGIPPWPPFTAGNETYLELGTELRLGSHLRMDQIAAWDAHYRRLASGSSPKLYAFDCGRLSYDSITMLGIEDHETDVRDLIVPCYVVEHEKGRLLWEGGLPSSLAEHDGWQEMDGGWRMRLDRTFEEQAAEIGLSMRDFDFMAFSHFHFDHVGIAGELEGARLIIQRPEYDVAFADGATPGYSPELYENATSIEPLILEGEHDVFGDGRVRLLPAPGHTPGHQVLYVDLANTGPVVLAGDLYVLRVGREERRPLAIDVDPDQSLKSMSRIEALLEETGASLWIGHDLARFDQAKKPPRFHD